MTDESAFEVGRNLAITPGSVVYRNELIELIQYDAATPTVYGRPLVLVPPCINKYYILDLTPQNSFVRHAVLQGHTTFMISWRNIPPELGHLAWDDYVEKGLLAAFDAARAITGSRTLNALGFCVGGTVLACALGGARRAQATRRRERDVPHHHARLRRPGRRRRLHLAAGARGARAGAVRRRAAARAASSRPAFASLRANELSGTTSSTTT
jgi:polyhydroxyalkanoate synthase